MNSSSDERHKELIIVARTVRARGLKGELVADLFTDFPERFEPDLPVAGCRAEWRI